MIRTFLSKFNLKEDQASNAEIRERIASGEKITGTNMFILIIAILIACIGLNLDSTAIVIGAMLVSPLMGVIISLAYGIASHDTAWIKRAIKAFLTQVGISMITSTVYFALSPIDVFSGELAARTQPNIFDVLIGILGGSAAIIANTRKNLISNVIPGTAIATALMPPLCTVGYCIANRNWISALGAAYLFTINSVFICLSAMIGLHIMNATENRELLKSVKSKIILTVFLLIAIIPSCILALQAVNSLKLQKSFRSFVNNEFQFEDTQIVTSSINPEKKQIVISLIGSLVDEDQIALIKKSLSSYSLNDYNIDIIQTRVDTGISKSELEGYLALNEDTGSKALTSDLSKELEDTKLLLKIQQDKDLATDEFLNELQVIYPQIMYCGFTDMHMPDQEEAVETLVVGVSSPLVPVAKTRIGKLLKLKFDRQMQIVEVMEKMEETTKEAEEENSKEEPTEENTEENTEESTLEKEKNHEENTMESR